MNGTGAQLVVRYLEQEGVQHIFGIPGGHLLPLYDALYDSQSIKPILTKHEGGAAFMAAGYALAGDRLGVCCATVGPGATNLVSGVASAYMASLPLLVLTAQVGTGSLGRGALQEAAGIGLRTPSHTAIYASITKHSEMVVRSDMLGEALRRSLRIAQTGRPGPVHLDLPADVMRGAVNEPIVPVGQYRLRLHCLPDPEAVKEAARLLAGAKSPAILAGAGARRGQGPAALLALAEMLECPVATTLLGKGALSEHHRLALGPVGLYGTRTANEYLRGGVDVLLAVGTSLHEFTTHVWDPAMRPSQALIHIDIDPEQIGRNYATDIGLVGDAGVVLSAIREAVALLGRDQRPKEQLLSRLKEQTEYFDEPAMSSSAMPLKPQRVVAELGQALPDSTMIFTDIGNNLAWVERNLRVSRPDQVMSLAGLAAMGSGVAAVIGGKLARPDRPAICVCGDGDLQMHGMEIATATSYGLPVIWLVLENGMLGMIKDVQVSSYRNRRIAHTFFQPDLVKLAEALGGIGLRAVAPGEVRAAVEAALTATGPVVIAVPVDPDEMPPTKPRMLAMERSMGLPPVSESLRLGSIRALWTMFRESGGLRTWLSRRRRR